MIPSCNNDNSSAFCCFICLSNVRLMRYNSSSNLSSDKLDLYQEYPMAYTLINA